MPSSSYMPAKQDEQVHWSHNFATVINGHGGLYGLTTPQTDAFVAVDTALQTAYTAATTASTRTKITVEQKTVALKNMKVMARSMVGIIQSTPTVTDAMKLQLGITVRKTHGTPVPAPTQKPFVKIAGVDGRTVSIELRQNSSRRGKPAQVSRAAVYIATGATAPASMNDWTFYSNENKTTFTVTFPPSATGETVWFTASWYNNKNQSGPAADPVSTNIAAGGTLPQSTKAFKLRAA